MMDKKNMLEAIISHYTEGNKAKFATLLGVSPQTISAWGARNTFDAELIYTKCSDVSADWLLTGHGSMLRDNQHQESTQPASAVQVDTSSNDATIYYKMYKEEKAENKALIEEIGGLKERIRQLESQDKESNRHTKISEALEAFTSESFGDYGEDSSPTNQPTTSKRLSAGKM